MASENKDHTVYLKRSQRIKEYQKNGCNSINVKKEIRKRVKRIREILKKKESERNDIEKDFLSLSPDIVATILKQQDYSNKFKQRQLEKTDKRNILFEKCSKLVEILQKSTCVVIYTGAGISTAASIPDYRGPNGVWTKLQQGKSVHMEKNLCDAQPTYTHMALVKLCEIGKVKHILSQNCDGLHIRSGLPRECLSEIHGNMFIEICKNCSLEYIRVFDVTERTAYRRHETGRKCIKCGGELYDTIVHFGERGTLKSPYNWHKISQALEKCDLIICLGSSLKVLKKYHCLWKTQLRLPDRTKLAIVNLQWTPKDKKCDLKINGRCDEVMKIVMNLMDCDVPVYDRSTDQLIHLHAAVPDSEVGLNCTKECDFSPAAFSQVQDMLLSRDSKSSSDQLHRNSDHGSQTSLMLNEQVEIKTKVEKQKFLGIKLVEDDVNNHRYHLSCNDGRPGGQINRHPEDYQSGQQPGWFGNGLKLGRIGKQKKVRKHSTTPCPKYQITYSV